MQNSLVLVRGGGDLASGVVVRLYRAQIRVVVLELPQPLAVRRMVSFSSAIYEKQIAVEGVTGRLVPPVGIPTVLAQNEIPVLIDPDASILTDRRYEFCVVVDGRMRKQPPEPLPRPVGLHIGLGPGFHAGQNCDAVIETRRSHTLGRVYWNGTTQADSGQPEGDPRRVLRAPGEGIITALVKIGTHIRAGQAVAVVQAHGQADIPIESSIQGVLRGLIQDGVRVTQGMKIGDIDPRDEVSACYLVSDKALAVGGGVLEAILSKGEIRRQLWN